MLAKIIVSFLLFIAFTNASRVIYMIMHAEKPNYGVLDKGNYWSSTQDIPNERNNGLGITGVERSKCLVDVFGKNAPSYRQPKKIIYQHYEKQGDFIDSGARGKHQSRRMYETPSLLAQDLGINLDEEKCCGGDPDDMYNYIESLDPSINPILIVHQHQQNYEIAKKYAKKYGKTLKYTEFKYDSSTVWTLVEGEIIENWGMNCYFDTPKKDEVKVDNLDQLIKGNDLKGIDANDNSLLQNMVPLITTKAVPASLLTTITAKVPPTGASTMGQPDQPATISAEITTSVKSEASTSTLNEDTVTTITTGSIETSVTTSTITIDETVSTTTVKDETVTTTTTTKDETVTTTTTKDETVTTTTTKDEPVTTTTVVIEEEDVIPSPDDATPIKDNDDDPEVTEDPENDIGEDDETIIKTTVHVEEPVNTTTTQEPAPTSTETKSPETTEVVQPVET